MQQHWFVLDRHDDEPPTEPPPGDPPAPEPGDDPPAEPPGDGQPGEDSGKEPDWKAQAEKWKALARKHETQAKANAQKAKKYDEVEEAQKTEAERLAAAKEAAEQRAAAAIQRAVRAEVKALATEFADPTDAEAAITPSEFVRDDGEIDTDAIQARLAELLDAKPHWRKAPPAPPRPKPDPGQGARGAPAEIDYRTASKDELAAALAEHRLTPRS